MNYLPTFTTQDASATRGGVHCTGTVISHAPAAGSDNSGFSLDVATGTITASSLTVGGTSLPRASSLVLTSSAATGFDMEDGTGLGGEDYDGSADVFVTVTHATAEDETIHLPHVSATGKWLRVALYNDDTGNALTLVAPNTENVLSGTVPSVPSGGKEVFLFFAANDFTWQYAPTTTTNLVDEAVAEAKLEDNAVSALKVAKQVMVHDGATETGFDMEDGTGFTSSYSNARDVIVMIDTLTQNETVALPNVPVQGAWLRVVVLNNTLYTFGLAEPTSDSFSLSGSPPAVAVGDSGVFEFYGDTASSWQYVPRFGATLSASEAQVDEAAATTDLGAIGGDSNYIFSAFASGFVQVTLGGAITTTRSLVLPAPTRVGQRVTILVHNASESEQLVWNTAVNYVAAAAPPAIAAENSRLFQFVAAFDDKWMLLASSDAFTEFAV